ncbi:MAG: RNA polymerase sigma factor [Cyclobacteriaceae bacterium]
MKEDFTHIIQQHQGIIHKVCRIYRDTPEDREDLFQEILFQLWKAWPTFRREAQPSTWMYRIALSTAVARFRKKSPQAEPMPAPVQKVEESVHPEKDRLYRAIGLLSDADKALINALPGRLCLRGNG